MEHPRRVGVALGSGYQTYFAALDSATQASVIKSMQAANIKWVRIDADWDLVEEDQGTYNWGTADTVANALTSNGMNVVIPALTNRRVGARWCGRELHPAEQSLAEPEPVGLRGVLQRGGHVLQLALRHTHVRVVERAEPGHRRRCRKGRDSGDFGGHLSPIGFAGLATVAYPAIKAADPDAFVLGGTLATHDEYGYGGTGRSGVSWTAITEGATTAQISCTTAVKGTTDDPGDQYMLIADAATA